MLRLEAQASVLSVAPAFDEHVAADILKDSHDWLGELEGGQSDPIAELRLAGLLVEWHGVMRIADPLKSDLASRLAAENPSRYRASAQRFADHACNGFHGQLVSALGDRGAAVSLAVLALTAADKESENEEVDLLIDTLQAPGARSVDTALAVRQLERSPISRPSIDRVATFLGGLYAWRKGERRIAADKFERVLARPNADRTEAIARHLLGVYNADQADFTASLLYLETACDLLRKLEDRRGLAQTLTSYGRVLRASAGPAAMSGNSGVASDQLLSATAALEEAISIGDAIADNLIKGGALLELSRVEQESERLDSAIVLAEEAAGVLSAYGGDLLAVYIHLGTLYRMVGVPDDARKVLKNAVSLASQIGANDMTLARILNVQASADRRLGLADDAIQNARESVQIGQRHGDRKHVAHALHTLSAALLDVGTPDAIDEAIEHLTASLELLEAMGDKKGLQMVENTLRRTKSAT